MVGKTPSTLRVNFSACSGCRACSIVCALVHEEQLDLHHARIRVHKNLPELDRPVFKPHFCRMCRNARCIAACPTGALYEDENNHQVVLKPELCNGCGKCVTACPFDAIWLDERTGLALKCDLCQGDPMCVKFCSPHALEFDRRDE